MRASSLHRSLLLCAAVGCTNPFLPPPVEKPQLAPVAEEEARRLFAVLVEHLKAGRLERVFDQIAWEPLLARVLVGLPMRAKAQRGYLAGMKEGAKKNHLGFGEVARQLEGGGVLTVLRSGEEEGGRTLTVRLIMAEGGFNYLTLLLDKGADGAVRIVDYRSLTTGEWLSAGMRRLLLPQLQRGVPDLVRRLAGHERDYLTELKKVTAFAESVAQGDNRRALTLYAGLPKSLRKDKNLLNLRMRACADDEAKHLAALDDYVRFYPDDPDTQLHLIDLHFMRKRYDAVLAQLERLRRSVGEEPYFDLLAAQCHIEKADYAAAHVAAARSVAAEPDIVQFYWPLLTVHLRRNAHREAAELMLEMQRRFDLIFRELETQEEYVRFAASKDYPSYLRRSRALAAQ